MSLMMQQPMMGGGMPTQPMAPPSPGGGMFSADAMQGRMNNPLNAGLMGFGMNTLQANAQGAGTGGSLLAGLGGGMGGYMGAKDKASALTKETKRRRALEGVLGRLGDIGMGAGDGPPQIGSMELGGPMMGGQSQIPGQAILDQQQGLLGGDVGGAYQPFGSRQF